MFIDTLPPDALGRLSQPPAPVTPDAPADTSRARLTRRGAERLALGGLLLGTALLYLWGLSESGWANSFYAAAAQAGSESWKAFFFGSSDAANSITVDKTPLSLWPMALSIRLFGLSSWSLLVPQALIGVASVALLHATVRRTTDSAVAGLVAGLTLALTPVATLMFRFDNPDAMLVLLLIGAAYATTRALESPRAVRWLAFAGALVGLAFLTKMLQAFLVLPALATAYALFATVPWRRRIVHLLVAFGAMVAAAGWWIATVELWPADSRPWIGGSQNNSVLELTLGYNGFGRLTGEETGSVGGNGGWGETGFWRLFDAENGGQASWLLPAALLLGVVALWFAGRRARAGLTIWLGWLVVTWLIFSFMAGIFHAYYSVALAPAIGAVVAISAHVLWQRRDSLIASGTLALATALTTSWAFVLLDRAGDWHPWLKYAVATFGFAAALMLAGVRHLPKRVGQAVAGVALVAALAGPFAFSVATAATPHTGSIPSAGPSTSGMPGGGGSPGGGGPAGASPGGGGAAGGLLNGSDPGAELTAELLADADDYTWVAATTGSNSASGYQLATGEPVMAIGGFNGSDPSPTLAQFQAYVAAGRIHWYIGGNSGFGGEPGGGMGGSGAASEISTWVSENFTAQTIDGVTLYDLSQGAS